MVDRARDTTEGWPRADRHSSGTRWLEASEPSRSAATRSSATPTWKRDSPSALRAHSTPPGQRGARAAVRGRASRNAHSEHCRRSGVVTSAHVSVPLTPRRRRRSAALRRLRYALHRRDEATAERRDDPRTHPTRGRAARCCRDASPTNDSHRDDDRDSAHRFRGPRGSRLQLVRVVDPHLPHLRRQSLFHRRSASLG